MSEETTASKAPESSASKTLQICCTVLVTVLAIFMVVSLNSIKEELKTMNNKLDVVQSSQTSLAAFEMKDPDGKVAYTFSQRILDVGMEMEGEGAACPAPK